MIHDGAYAGVLSIMLDEDHEAVLGVLDEFEKDGYGDHSKLHTDHWQRRNRNECVLWIECSACGSWFRASIREKDGSPRWTASAEKAVAFFKEDTHLSCEEAARFVAVSEVMTS